jgi:hypothetical protein
MESYKQYLSEEESQQEEGLKHLLRSQNGVHFEAEIQEIKVKKLASGDKGLRVILDTNSMPGRAGKLDDLWECGEIVSVLIYRVPR